MLVGYIYICNIFFYIPFTTFQEACLKGVDNKPSSQPKIRKNVNPYGEIIYCKYPNAGMTKIEKC